MRSSCVSMHPREPQSGKQRCAASSRGENSARQSQKTRVPRVAPGKIIKAQTMLINGYSQREIGRVLHLSPHTVAKVVKTEDFQNFIRSKREELFGIAPLALDSFRAGVTRDPRLAYVFLKDLGIVPSRDAMLGLAHIEPPPESMDDRVARQTNYIAAVILERHKVFGIELPADMKAALEKEKADSEKMADLQTQPDPYINNVSTSGAEPAAR